MFIDLKLNFRNKLFYNVRCFKMFFFEFLPANLENGENGNPISDVYSTLGVVGQLVGILKLV